jgi:putative ABC transport system permease protein
VIIRASLRALTVRRARTGLAVAGIAVSVALLLDMTMLGSGLTTSFTRLVAEEGYAMRVTPAGTLPFDSEAGIRDAAAAARSIEAIEGVAGVAPILGARLYLGREGDAVATSGIDPARPVVYRLVEGRAPAAGEGVVSQPLAKAAGVGVGGVIEVAPELDPSLGTPRRQRALRISGIAEFYFDEAGQRSLALPLADLQEMTGRPDQVSLFAIAPAPGADEEALVRDIEAAVSGVSAYSTAALSQALDDQLLYFRQLAAILASVALVVTALLVATIVTIGVRERFGEIATLRAIGASRGRLLAGIVVQGAALAGAGALIGLPLGLLVGEWLDGILLALPGIPAAVSFFVWDPGRVAGALAVALGVGVLAGALPGLLAVRTPLSAALREEAE